MKKSDLKNEGYQWIIKRWFKPWLKLLPPEWDMVEKLEILMRCDKRRIDAFRCHTDCRVIGDAIFEGQPIPGLRLERERKVKKGQVVWVREDLDEPWIEVETAHEVFRIEKLQGKYFVDCHFDRI